MVRPVAGFIKKYYPHKAEDEQQRAANGQFGSGGGSGHSTSGKPERKGTPSKGMSQGEMKSQLAKHMESYSSNPKSRERAQALAKELGKATGKSAQSILEGARK